jgi:hypothetical protein
MSVLTRPVFLLFQLHLIVGFHFLLDIFVHIVLKDIGANPNAYLINTLLQILHPILLRLLAVYTPNSNRHLLSALPRLPPQLLIRFILSLARCVRIRILRKQKALLQAS